MSAFGLLLQKYEQDDVTHINRFIVFLGEATSSCDGRDTRDDKGKEKIRFQQVLCGTHLRTQHAIA